MTMRPGADGTFRIATGIVQDRYLAKVDAMPLFYVDTFGDVAVFDDVGTEFPDTNALYNYVRATLAMMIANERTDDGGLRCYANVRDASGRQVLGASLVLTLSPPPVPAS